VSSGPDRPPGGRAAPGAFELLQIGAMCGVSIGLGLAVGLLLDRAFGTSPLLVLLGLVVGILGAAAGAYFVIRPYVTDASRGAPTPKD
jgi:F0F1-type ATP synthase assembly protein I